MRWIPPDASPAEVRLAGGACLAEARRSICASVARRAWLAEARRSVRRREGGPWDAVALSFVRPNEGGFTLVDLLVVIGLLGVLSAIGIPLLNTTTVRLRLSQAAQDVRSELQGAKQRAVASNRPIRIRFNCPSAGIYRAVELIGTPGAPNSSDSNLDRCNDTVYPYPAADRDPSTRPNVDGQVRRLPTGIAFGAVKTIEFWPDGTAHSDSGSGNPWPPVATTGVTLTLTQGTRTASIQVNGVGRITLDVQ